MLFYIRIGDFDVLVWLSVVNNLAINIPVEHLP